MRAIEREQLVGAGTTARAGLAPGMAPPLLRSAAADDVAGGFDTPSTRRTLPVLVLSDLLALVVSLFVGSLVGTAVASSPSLEDAARSVVYAVAFLPVFAVYGVYRRARRRLVSSTFPDLSQLLHGLVLGSLVILAAASTVHRLVGLEHVTGREVIPAGILAAVAIPATRAVARRLDHPARGRSRVLVVGSGQVAGVVLQRLRNVEGVEVVGCVDDGFIGSTDPGADPKLLGRLDDLPDLVRRLDVDHVVVAFSPATGATLASLLRSLADEVRISVVPRLFDLLTVRSSVDDLYGLPVVDVAPASLGPADRFAKRALDLVVAGTALLVLSPLAIAIAAAVKVTSPGPVLFRQQRTGRGGRAFAICKFRTMVDGAEGSREKLVASNEVDGPLFKLRCDPRVTRVGSFLRKTSLDELPQLLNVVSGKMSLVGPRPFVEHEAAGIEGWAARRFDVRPGMTGLWQISGRNDLPYSELCRLDYSYVASWSLWWDVRILWHTPASVFRRLGAY